MSSRVIPIRALSLGIGLASAVDPAEGTDPEKVPRLVLAALPADPNGLGEPYWCWCPPPAAPSLRLFSFRAVTRDDKDPGNGTRSNRHTVIETPDIKSAEVLRLSDD